MQSDNDKLVTEEHNKRRSIGRRNYDSANVVRLALVPVPPNAETVALIEKLLELAKQGKITGLAYVSRINGGTIKGIAGLENGCRNTVRGAVLSLANEI